MRLNRILTLLLLPLLEPLTGMTRALASPDTSAIAYEQRQGNELPKQVLFRDENGRMVRLAGLIGSKPLIVLLGYFRCARLCSVIRESLAEVLGVSSLDARRDYTLIVVSIDPSETSGDAAAAKAHDLQRLRVSGAVDHWHYLTGSGDAIDAIADAVGFHARGDPARNTFIHPAGIVFVTPAGFVSSYLLGVGYQAKDVQLAVTRAASGDIGPPSSPVLLFCFDYDPETGRYTFAIIKLLRLAAMVTVVTAAGMVLRACLRERRA